jgi:hypothetical protein
MGLAVPVALDRSQANRNEICKTKPNSAQRIALADRSCHFALFRTGSDAFRIHSYGTALKTNLHSARSPVTPTPRNKYWMEFKGLYADPASASKRNRRIQSPINNMPTPSSVVHVGLADGLAKGPPPTAASNKNEPLWTE